MWGKAPKQRLYAEIKFKSFIYPGHKKWELCNSLP